MTDTRIVPVEPTEEMLIAGVKQYYSYTYDSYPFDLRIRECWKAMLSASPGLSLEGGPPSQGPTEEIARVIERTIGDLMPDRCVHTLNGDRVIYGERLSWPGVNLTKISEEAARAVQSLYTGRKP